MADDDRLQPDHLACDTRVAFYKGDSSERCLVCGHRGLGSWYVGQHLRFTDEDLPERFPVCSKEHGLMWMRAVFDQELDQELEPGDNRPA